MATPNTHVGLFLLLLCACFILSCGYSLAPAALVQERQYYEFTVDNAAQAALQKLSDSNEVTKGSRVSKVDLEDTEVAEMVLYTIGLKLDIGNASGINYDFQFVQPLSPWRPLRSTSAMPPLSSLLHLPSTQLALHGGAASYAPPEISLVLNGPLELHFPQAFTELIVMTPRHLDVGAIDRMVLKEGANITLTGAVELRLRESLSLDASVSVEGNHVVIDTKDIPKINVYGRRIVVANMAGEELEVKKQFSGAVVSPRDSAVVRTGRVPFVIALNDTRVKTIKQALMQISASANISSLPRVRQLGARSSMEAVVCFSLPLELEDKEAGTSSSWDVLVAQGSNHQEAQVISVTRQRFENHITFSPDLVHNGTLSSAMDNLDRYLRTSNFMM